MSLREDCHEIVNSMSEEALEETFQELQDIRDHYIDIQRACGNNQTVEPRVVTARITNSRFVGKNDPYTQSEIDIIDSHNF